MSLQSYEVPKESLTAICNPNSLGFESTEEVQPLEGTIGQERAVSALEFGLGIDAPGFNVFVSGLAGTGRNTTLKAYLERASAQKETPNDWGYVHNFSNPSCPMAIDLPCGMVSVLAKDMDELIESCTRGIPTAFDSDSYQHQIEEVLKEVQAKKSSIYAALEQEASKAGYTINLTQAGIVTIPIKDGRPMEREEYDALSEEDRNRLKEMGEGLQHSISHRVTDIKKLDKEAIQMTSEVDRQVGLFTIRPLIQEIKEKFSEHPKVLKYLEAAQTDIVENLGAFKSKEEQSPVPVPGQWNRPADNFPKYRVNTLVDNEGCKGAPIVFEFSPTYYNLFGRIDYRPSFGTVSTDLTMIKPGALHKANGGFLVVQALDLFANPLSWPTLKRTL